MRCKICDSLINKPVWNAQLNDWEICKTCLDIVNHVFEDPVVDNPYEEPETEEVDDLETLAEKILLDNTTLV